MASGDKEITRASCAASDPSCLTPGEAKAIDSMWLGPVACAKGETSCKVPDTASRKLNSKKDLRLWYGQTRGTDLGSLGGTTPFLVVPEQNKYWVYFDPAWDWKSVTADNFLQYFKDNVDKVGPMMGTDNPDLRAFQKKGGKLIIWHGWADPLINANGSVDYYERVVDRIGSLKKTQQFARLFMAPGVGHCGGGGPSPQNAFKAVVDWVEKGIAPESILASRGGPGAAGPGAAGPGGAAPGGAFGGGRGGFGGGGPAATPMSRPLCPYPAVAKYKGSGSTDEAANFSCAAPGK
jgi:hypothetical protein